MKLGFQKCKIALTDFFSAETEMYYVFQNRRKSSSIQQSFPFHKVRNEYLLIFHGELLLNLLHLKIISHCVLVFKSNGLKRERDCDVQKREGKNQARKEESEEHISSDVVGLVIETSTIFFSIREIDLVFDFTRFLPGLFKISDRYIPRGELYYKHT